AHWNRAILRLAVGLFELFPPEKFANNRQIQLQEQCEQWRLFTRRNHFTDKGHLDGSKKKGRFVTEVSRFAQRNALASLNDHGQTRFVLSSVTSSLRCQAIQREARHGRGLFSRDSRMRGNLLCKLNPQCSDT